MLWMFMIFDLLALLTATSLHFGWFFSPYLIFVSCVYLVVKGMIFIDWMSYIDIACAIYIALMAYFHLQTFIYYILLFWFLYKLFFTIVRV